MARYESARQFFEDAPGRVDPARAGGYRASYRFDVEGAGTWRVDVDEGRVEIVERGGDADCVVSTSEETFLRIVNGETSPIGAYMLGKVRIEGNLSLVAGLRDVLNA